MKWDAIIAQGEKVDIYRQGDRAIKVFKADIPKTTVLYEALTQARVEETGLHVPKIYEVFKTDGLWAIEMDHIEGKTMQEVMDKNSDNIDALLEEMVDLHLEIHSKFSPMMNKLKDILIADIKALDSINNDCKYELLTRLDSMPKHKKLCHGNFTPSNIIVQGDKIYVVDWFSASQGNASADVARTYLLFALQSQEIADKYLNLFCQKTDTDKRYVQAWIPIVAAGQLKQNKPEEKELLMKWVDIFN